MINSSGGSSPPSVLEKMEGRRRMRQKWKKTMPQREKPVTHAKRKKEVSERKKSKRDTCKRETQRQSESERYIQTGLISETGKKGR